MTTKIENIDVDALTEKVRNFITSVKETFVEIKAKIEKVIDFVKNSAIGKLLTGNAQEISIAVAPLAIKSFGKGLLEKGSRANPMFVKQADKGLFDGLKDKGGAAATPASFFKQIKTLATKPKYLIVTGKHRISPRTFF